MGEWFDPSIGPSVEGYGIFSQCGRPAGDRLAHRSRNPNFAGIFRYDEQTRSICLAQVHCEVNLDGCASQRSMAICAGSLATISCEPRQARKGTAAAVASGAEVKLAQVAALISGGFRLAPGLLK